MKIEQEYAHKKFDDFFWDFFLSKLPIKIWILWEGGFGVLLRPVKMYDYMYETWNRGKVYLLSIELPKRKKKSVQNKKNEIL